MLRFHAAALVAGPIALLVASPARAQHAIATMTGPEFQAQLGSTVAAAGDLNGDGHRDFVARVKHWYGTDLNDYMVHVFLGPVTGDALAPSATLFEPIPNSNFGAALDGDADVNGDGWSDLLVGAPESTLQVAQQGQTHLFLGSAAGLPATPSWTTQSFQQAARLGWSVEFAGDVDADGFVDAVIGAPYTMVNLNLNAGRVRLFRGGASGLEANPVWVLDATYADARYGYVVFGGGDSNADGFADFGIGVQAGQGPFWPFSPGEVQVFHGTPGTPSTTPSLVLHATEEAYNDFGISVVAGNWNGDAYSDLLVGSSRWNNDFGRAYAFHGSATGLAPTPATILQGKVDSGYFGIETFSAGDLEGDGFDDALVYAVAGTSSLPNGGKAHLFRGGAPGLSTVASWSQENFALHTAFGAAMAGVGDVDEDGFGDFLVAAPLLNDSQVSDTGRLYLYGDDCGASASAVTYGIGKPGASGVPTLTASAPPDVGSTITLALGNGLTGSAPLLFLGLAPAALPFDGGSLLVAPSFVIPLPPFDGTGTMPLPVPVPAGPGLCGAVAYLQAMFVDPAATGPYHTAQTKGLSLTIGD